MVSRIISRLLKNSSCMTFLSLLGLGTIYGTVSGCVTSSNAILTYHPTKISESFDSDEVFSIDSNSSALQILPANFTHCSLGESSIVQRCNTSKRRMYLAISHHHVSKFSLQRPEYSTWSLQDTGMKSSGTAEVILARKNSHNHIITRLSKEITSVSLTMAGYTTYSNYVVHSKRKIAAPEAYPRSGGKSAGSRRRTSGGGTYGTSSSSTVGGLSHLEFILLLAGIASVLGCCCYCCCAISRKQEATEAEGENVASASKIYQDDGNTIADQQETDGFIVKESVPETADILNQTLVAKVSKIDSTAQENCPSSMTTLNQNTNSYNSVDGCIAKENYIGTTKISEQNLSTEFPVQILEEEPFGRSCSRNISSRGEAIDLKFVQSSIDDEVSLTSTAMMADGSAEERFPCQNDCQMGEIVERLECRRAKAQN